MSSINNPLSFGLSKIHAEPGEKRAFLPDFVAKLIRMGANILLEEGYGKELGYSEAAYRNFGDGSVHFGALGDVYQQEYVLVLRCPSNEILSLLRPGSCLISMLHYPTRPARVEFLRNLEIEAISLDSIKDDTGRRLVENLRSVGWNGMETAFRTLQQIHPDFENPKRSTINVSLLGAGAVGVHVMQAATRYANEALRNRFFELGIPGVLVRTLDYDTTKHSDIMHRILSDTDILVDATQRLDTSQPVIPNEWITWMPNHAVLLDLSVDPYQCSEHPFSVKGIEGIPQGNLDQYIFSPNDQAYNLIPKCINTTHRRWAVSCYSWPGIYPVECMQVYGKQILPILRRIIDLGGTQNIKSNGSYFERAISRSLLSNWSTTS